ncbi:MAG: hypothetical protein C5B50_26245 [Verrucomicrobia bacterium]|nr:MAG: hypothetical protein C5B50_26245 [Verrucomicrobiota bacterium]
MQTTASQSRRARGTRPDAIAADKFYLIKNLSMLRATYQIRLLTFFANKSGKRLVLKVPKGCQFAPSLHQLIKSTGAIIVREDL